jgi:hypothetical protein
VNSGINFNREWNKKYLDPFINLFSNI